jgi:hypothetical protein
MKRLLEIHGPARSIPFQFSEYSKFSPMQLPFILNFRKLYSSWSKVLVRDDNRRRRGKTSAKRVRGGQRAGALPEFLPIGPPLLLPPPRPGENLPAQQFSHGSSFLTDDSGRPNLPRRLWRDSRPTTRRQTSSNPSPRHPPPSLPVLAPRIPTPPHSISACSQPGLRYA